MERIRQKSIYFIVLGLIPLAFLFAVCPAAEKETTSPKISEKGVSWHSAEILTGVTLQPEAQEALKKTFRPLFPFEGKSPPHFPDYRSPKPWAALPFSNFHFPASSRSAVRPPTGSLLGSSAIQLPTDRPGRSLEETPSGAQTGIFIKGAT